MKEQTVRQKRFLSTNLAGTTFDGRQETLKELSKKRAFYKLVRDKDNEYDKYAVKVIAIDSNKKTYPKKEKEIIDIYKNFMVKNEFSKTLK